MPNLLVTACSRVKPKSCMFCLRSWGKTEDFIALAQITGSGCTPGRTLAWYDGVCALVLVCCLSRGYFIGHAALAGRAWLPVGMRTDHDTYQVYKATHISACLCAYPTWNRRWTYKDVSQGMPTCHIFMVDTKMTVWECTSGEGTISISTWCRYRSVASHHALTMKFLSSSSLGVAFEQSILLSVLSMGFGVLFAMLGRLFLYIGLMVSLCV